MKKLRKLFLSGLMLLTLVFSLTSCQLADTISVPFAFLLRFFNGFTGSYALALLLFALLVKLILLPFSIKQQKNQIKGAKLRPKMLQIEKKYAGRNDQVTLKKKQEELMQLQQAEGYSPLSGCLPLLIQLPIIYILYAIIRNPLTHICKFSSDVIIKLYNAVHAAEEGFTAVTSTSGIDQIKLIHTLQGGGFDSVYQEATGASGSLSSVLPNFNLFGVIDLTQQPSLKAFNWLLLIPLITFIGSFVTMKLSKKLNGNLQQMTASTQDQKVSMAIMDWMMPLMSTWIAFVVPSALGVYWFYQSLIGIVQMLILAKLMPMPTYTKEELEQMIKDMKRQQAGRPVSSQSRPGASTGERPRSLHHIDDDDEDFPALPQKKPQQNQPKKKATNGIAPAPLKNEEAKDASAKENEEFNSAKEASETDQKE